MKSLFQKLFRKNNPPIYGPRIFLARSWLEKQIDEAIYKRSFNLD